MKLARRVDLREMRLKAEIEKRKLEVKRRAEAVSREAIALVDVRESIRKNPVVGVLSAVSLGVVVGSLAGGRRKRVEDRRQRPPGHPLLSGLALSLTGRMMDLIVPVIPGLMGQIFQRVRGHGQGPEQSAGTGGDGSGAGVGPGAGGSGRMDAGRPREGGAGTESSRSRTDRSSGSRSG